MYKPMHAYKLECMYTLYTAILHRPIIKSFVHITKLIWSA